MIEVCNLTKDYGDRTAISNLNFSINKGEVVGFLGPNGAGKSTTMKIITGAMSPSSGQVTVDGVDVFEDPLNVKKKIGYLPESPPVYFDMTVTAYLKYIGELRGIFGAQLSENIAYAIDAMNLDEVKDRLIQNLSKGFRQRVGISQALISQPEILILDEPTVGLDPKQVSEVRELLKKLKGKHTVILSTHILSEVQESCDRVIIVNHGKIIAQDTIKGLRERVAQETVTTLKVLRDIEQARELINSSFEVTDVTVFENNLSFTHSLSELELENVVSKLVDAKLGLIEFSSKSSKDLEDVFIELTSLGETEQ